MTKKCFECYWDSQDEEICERCGKPLKPVVGGTKDESKTQTPPPDKKK